MMHTNQFDDLARVLARGASRRRILHSLMAGASGSLLALFGYAGKEGAYNAAQAATTGQLYLPVIANPHGAICAQASVCGGRQYCSEDQTCLCIASAEGPIQCGKIPSCGAQLCQTSADCAHLGEGYFCDAPNSGCCDENQRCIAPCTEPCPPDRTCGDVCCPAGEICADLICAGASAGTWTGTVQYEDETIGIRFIMQQSGGDIGGRMLMADPESGEFLETGEVSGTRSGDGAFWTTEAASIVQGDFDGDSFSGVMNFSSQNNEPSLSAQISLTRDENARTLALATASAQRY